MDLNDLRILRNRLRVACRIMDGAGLTEGFGHMSSRIPGTDHILITPALGPGQVTRGKLIIFDLNGDCIANPASVPAVLETPMHLAIYRARPDVGAICRTYSRHAVILGGTGRPVHARHGLGGMLGALVPVHPESDLNVNPAMGNAVAQSLADHTALLLRGNGALATGPDVERAVVHAIYLEEAAQIELAMLTIPAVSAVGGAAPLTSSELDKRQRWYENEARHAWEYYVWKYAS